MSRNGFRKGDELLDELNKEKPHYTPFVPGNTYSKKLTTKELKEEAFRQYCEHLAKGKSKRSWWFEHPELSLTWETMEKYLREDPDFDSIKKSISESKGFRVWEDVVEESANGKNRKANTATLQMLMRNKFGWDKEADKQNPDFNVHIELNQALMEQITKFQEARKRDTISINAEQKS